MRDQHLYKSPAIEVYGHCRLLLPWYLLYIWGRGKFIYNININKHITITLTEGAWLIFFQSGVEKLLAWANGDWAHNPLDLCSQLGAYDLSATATP